MSSRRLPFRPIFSSTLLAGLLPFTATAAGLRSPYTADANTVHLYHFDEAAGSVATSNAGTAGGTAYAVNGNPLSTTPPTTTAILSATAYTGFGLAADLSQGTGHVIGYDANGSGAFQADASSASLSPDRITLSTLGVGGSSPFTLEALVCPLSSTGQREIIATDSSASSRGFQFRITTGGTTGQRLEFNLIATGQDLFAEIPITGTHAFATGQWYHVAFVYTGTTAQFYWTALSPERDAPNPVGNPITVTFTGGASVQGPLTFGNENRNTPGEPLVGKLDEVRISNVARATTDFLFEPIDTTTDTDHDGLPDYWETKYFGNFDANPTDDPDHDGYDNAAEFAAGSNPTDPASTPIDLDADGLPDAWEMYHFGHLNYGPTDDPDSDGFNNAAEYAAGSAPGNSASTPSDTDGEGLPDAWEMSHFGTLDYNAGDDPDGDGFTNIQEYLAGTDPTDAASRPEGPTVTLVPVDDGDPRTSEFGYAGDSAINSVTFVRSSIKTVGNQQFMTWYGRHQYDSGATYNNTMWIGRRTVGSSHWYVFRHPTFTANTITDGHDVISFGIDGAGYMHLSWGMHGDAFHYSRSTGPVTGDGPIELGPDTTMTGREDTVTYPQFLTLPDGDLLFIFREGYSGSGGTYVNRYSIATQTWSNVHLDRSIQKPFIEGRWAPSYDYNAYLNMPQLGGADGNSLVLTFCWRYLPVNAGSLGSPGGFAGYQTNNRINFARSLDAGVTWEKSDGTPYTLPITRDAENGVEAGRAEILANIPEGYSLINQASTCLDSAGFPITATWWAPETGSNNYRRQYMVVFRDDDGVWQTRVVSNRTTDPTGTRYDENYVRNLGRPIVVRDDEDRIIVLYRDNQGSNSTGISNGLTIVHSLPRAEDPERLVWITFDLTSENLGNYEPVIDNEAWDLHRKLDILYQQSAGQGYSPPANTASRISVLEWDAAAYFAHSAQPVLKSAADGTSVTLTWHSEPGFTYELSTSTDLINWETVGTYAGTGSPMSVDRPLTSGEPKRFWQIHRIEGTQ